MTYYQPVANKLNTEASQKSYALCDNECAVMKENGGKYATLPNAERGFRGH